MLVQERVAITANAFLCLGLFTPVNLSLLKWPLSAAVFVRTFLLLPSHKYGNMTV